MLLGRDSECRRISTLIAGLDANVGASLVLIGERGIGKTALLRHAQERANGARVLMAAGVTAERSLTFAGLHGLLRPVLGLLPQIPARQSAALSAGFALMPEATVDQFAVAAGTLNLLSAARGGGPLLVLVDDFELWDPVSREALLFVARRTGPEGVGVILTTASGDEETGLPGHRVPPIDAAASAELLCRAGFGPVAPAVLAQLVEFGAGLPLVLLETPTVLTPAQLRGAEPLPDPLPVGPRVRRAFAPDLAGLTAATRTALLVAAAAGESALAAILGAMAGLGLGDRELDAAEAGGLISLTGDGVRFRHPLLRSVVYHEATLAERRAAHRALAEVTRSALRARHLGTAALGPDQGAADELERTAWQGTAGLSVSGAARLMERAVELTGPGPLRGRRCVYAAELWQLAGAGDRVRELLDRSAQQTGDLAVRGYGHLVLALAESRCGRPVPAHRLLVREAARLRRADPAAAAVMLLDAADAYCLAGEPQAALVAVRQAATSAAPAGEPVPAVFAAQHAAVLALCGRLDEARDMLADSTAELEKAAIDSALPVGWRRILRLGLPALLARLGELEAAGRILDEAIGQARRLGACGLLPRLLIQRAELSLRTGDWAGAATGAGEAVRLAQRGGQVSDEGTAVVCLGRLAALRGRREECGGYLERARDILRRGRLGGLMVPVNAAEGLLELGAGEYEAAYVRLERVVRQVEAGSAADFGALSWVSDFVEAAVRVGRHREAQRLVAEVRPRAGGSLLLPALLARCDALLEPDRAEEHFSRVVPAGAGDPFEQARTDLCFGEWLCAQGRGADAALRLRSAEVVFHELDARSWASRTARALATLADPEPDALPPVTRTPADARLDVLTGQERRVALIVGHGATNREAASALFVTTKTIEFHLRGVYRKLGVRSRSELAHLVGQASGPIS